MGNRLESEIDAFIRKGAERVQRAGEIAAVQIIAGIDLVQAEQCGAQLRDTLIRKLNRLIERERQRGIRKHWAYDLNRHIALKQAVSRLKSIANSHM